MESALALLQAHGVVALSLALFAKRMGVPVPALPLLLVAGARGAEDAAFVLAAFAAGAAASIVADGLWFVAGRRHGRTVLALACRVSLSPGHCVSRTERVFAQRGSAAVLVGKFIPGVAGLAPPLAGALGMGGTRFHLLNAAGTVAWIGAGLGVGLLLHRDVKLLLHGLELLGAGALPLIAGVLALYLGWLAWMRRRAGRVPASAPECGPKPDGVP